MERFASKHRFLCIGTRILENATGETKSVDIKAMETKDIHTPARMISRVYEAFASGGEYQTFEDALARHRRLDSIAKVALRCERETLTSLRCGWKMGNGMIS